MGITFATTKIEANLIEVLQEQIVLWAEQIIRRYELGFPQSRLGGRRIDSRA